MKLSLRLISTIALAIAVTSPVAAQDVPSLDLKFGVLAGLSGDLAQSGQPWIEATRLAVEDLASKSSPGAMPTRSRSPSSAPRTARAMPRAASRRRRNSSASTAANVVIGDFYSSVTVAAAQSVFIPEQIIDFTGGTAPSITDLNKTTGATWMWRMAPPDSIQGPVVAKLIADALGANTTINVAARNDTYGVGLLDAFKKAWTAGGGKIGSETVYNPDAPTLDTEAQQIASGNPDGWFLVSFCGDWGKLKGPLQRAETGIRRRPSAVTRSAVALLRTRRWRACATPAAT